MDRLIDNWSNKLIRSRLHLNSNSNSIDLVLNRKNKYRESRLKLGIFKYRDRFRWNIKINWRNGISKFRMREWNNLFIRNLWSKFILKLLTSLINYLWNANVRIINRGW